MHVFLWLFATIVAGSTGLVLYSLKRDEPATDTSTGDNSSDMFTSSRVLTAQQKKRIDDYTAFQFESGKRESSYYRVNPNDTGAGISVGRHQHNQKIGTLWDVMKRCRELNQTLFDSFNFTGTSNQVFNMSSETAFKAQNHEGNIEAVKRACKQIFSVQQFKDAQDEVSIRLYLEPAIEYGSNIGLKEEVSFAVLFDSWIQNGGRNTRNRAEEVRERIDPAKDESGYIKSLAIAIDSRHAQYDKHRRRHLIVLFYPGNVTDYSKTLNP